MNHLAGKVMEDMGAMEAATGEAMEVEEEEEEEDMEVVAMVVVMGDTGAAMEATMGVAMDMGVTGTMVVDTIHMVDPPTGMADIVAEGMEVEGMEVMVVILMTNLYEAILFSTISNTLSILSPVSQGYWMQTMMLCMDHFLPS
jgi:hypothetical protein